MELVLSVDRGLKVPSYVNIISHVMGCFPDLIGCQDRFFVRGVLMSSTGMDVFDQAFVDILSKSMLSIIGGLSGVR